MVEKTAAFRQRRAADTARWRERLFLRDGKAGRRIGGIIIVHVTGAAATCMLAEPGESDGQVASPSFFWRSPGAIADAAEVSHD
jgi:hypothetical protein